MWREHHHSTQFRRDAIGVTVRLGNKIALQTRLGDIAKRLAAVQPGTGSVQRPWVQIGGENLDVQGLVFVCCQFVQHQRHRVSLFAGGTTGRPNPQTALVGQAVDHLGQHRLIQNFKGLRVAEKFRDANQQIPIKVL